MWCGHGKPICRVNCKPFWILAGNGSRPWTLELHRVQNRSFKLKAALYGKRNRVEFPRHTFSTGTHSQKQCLKGTGTRIVVGFLHNVFFNVLSIKLSTLQLHSSVQNICISPTKGVVLPQDSCYLGHNPTIELHHQQPWQDHLQVSMHPKEKTWNGGAWKAGKDRPGPMTVLEQSS